MFKIIKNKLKNNSEIFILILISIITVVFTTYYNYSKNEVNSNYKEIINNVYFKKTVNHFFNYLVPKFKKINHQIVLGENFDGILKEYSINNQ